MSLRTKMEQIALLIADGLLEKGVGLADRIDGLKTLSGYYATVKRAEAGDRNTSARWGELATAIQGRHAEGNGHADVDEE